MLAIAQADGEPLLPVQIPKVTFLIGEELGDFTPSDYYRFYPHWYGPYSAHVARDIEGLAQDGLVTSSLFYYDDDKGPACQYAVTLEAESRIKNLTASLCKEASFFVLEAVAWARSNSFTHICRSIYERYPDMAVNTKLDNASPIKDLRMPTLSSATAIMKFFEEG